MTIGPTWNVQAVSGLSLDRNSHAFGFVYERGGNAMSNMDVVNKIYAAFAGGNIPAVLELFDRRGPRNSSGRRPELLVVI